MNIRDHLQKFRERFELIYLLPVCAMAVAGLITYIVLVPDDHPADGQMAVNVRAMPKITSLAPSTILNAPLFNAERKAIQVSEQVPEGAPQLAENAPPTEPLPTLAGVVSKRGGKSAIVVKLADGTSAVLGRGESAGGWQVSRIETDKAWLINGAITEIVALDYSNKGEAMGGP